MFHYENWFQVEKKEDGLKFHTTIVPEEINIKETILKAADTIDDYSGGKIALFLSGGFDSQTTYNCLKAGGLEFDVFLINWAEENPMDLERAKMFAKLHSINYQLITINPTNFLENEFYDFIQKYEVTSPQWALHCKAYEVVKELGYDTIINGGDAFAILNGYYYSTLTSSIYFDSMDWCSKNNIKLIRYLSWLPELAFYFAYRNDTSFGKIDSFRSHSEPLVCYSTSGFRDYQRKYSAKTNVTNAVDVIYRNLARRTNKYYQQSKLSDSYLLFNGEKINVRHYSKRKL